MSKTKYEVHKVNFEQVHLGFAQFILDWLTEDSNLLSCEMWIVITKKLSSF